MKHKMKLQDAPFRLIESGIKTIELRLYDEKRRAICVGDEIEFTNANDTDAVLRCEVIEIFVFPSFAELYRRLPLEKCGYTSDRIAAASPSDMDLYYSTEEQKRYGVVGIEIKLL